MTKSRRNIYFPPQIVYLSFYLLLILVMMQNCQSAFKNDSKLKPIINSNLKHSGLTSSKSKVINSFLFSYFCREDPKQMEMLFFDFCLQIWYLYIMSKKELNLKKKIPTVNICLTNQNLTEILNKSIIIHKIETYKYSNKSKSEINYSIWNEKISNNKMELSRIKKSTACVCRLNNHY